MICNQSRLEHGDRAIAIYHVVYANEGFEHAAKAIFQLVQDARRLSPGKPRHLYLDIDEHRNANGGFDADMAELQQNFLPQVLMPFLSEIHCPLAKLKNARPQSDDLPEVLIIKEEP